MTSVNLFYPENQDLARRCQELVDDIVNIQSSVAGKQSDNNTMDADLTKLVNQVMTAHGYKSYTDLQNAVLASLTPDQRQKIEDSMKAAQKLNNGLDITFQVCMLLTTTAAVIGLGTKTFQFVKSGALSNAFAKRMGQFVDFFKTGRTALTESEKAAESVIKTVAEAGGEAGEAVSVGSKIVRFCKILGFVGVALDVFLIGLAAYEGSKQKDELISNIHYLNVRRVICKIYQRQANAVVDFSSQLKSVLTLMTMNKNGVMDSAIKALEDSFLGDVDTAWTSYGVLQAYQDLSIQDGARNSYLHNDLSLNDIQTEVNKAPDAPVNGPSAPQNASVATVVVSPKKTAQQSVQQAVTNATANAESVLKGVIKTKADIFEQVFQTHATLVHT